MSDHDRTEPGPTDHDAITDQLVDLLRGELGRRAAGEVVGHLRACDPCRLVLVDTAQVHGSLEAARRLLHPVPDDDAAHPAAPRAALPAASQAASQPPTPQLPPLRLPRRRRLALASAAVVTAAAVTTGVIVVQQRADEPATPPASVASVELRPLTGAGAGRVTMSAPGTETDMTISTQGLPAAGDGRFYYAWLLDPATQKMLPLGLVGVGTETHFDVPTTLVQRYHAVDISLQEDDGDPAHSATSVLRATY